MDYGAETRALRMAVWLQMKDVGAGLAYRLYAGSICDTKSAAAAAVYAACGAI